MFNRLIRMLRVIPALEQLSDKELLNLLKTVDSNIVDYDAILLSTSFFRTYPRSSYVSVHAVLFDMS